MQHRRLGDEAILDATPGLRRESLAAAFRYAAEHPEEIERDLSENEE